MIVYTTNTLQKVEE